MPVVERGIAWKVLCEESNELASSPMMLQLWPKWQAKLMTDCSLRLELMTIMFYAGCALDSEKLHIPSVPGLTNSYFHPRTPKTLFLGYFTRAYIKSETI